MESIFFKYAHPILITESELSYPQAQIIPYIFDCISDIIPHNAYIIDYCRKDFFFIAKDSIMLCGYSHDEAMAMGYSFFNTIFGPKELRIMEEVNEAGFNLFYSLPEDKRRDGFISYNLSLTRRDGSTLSVNHRFKPLLFCPDGNIWLAVCSIYPALSKSSGDVFVSFKASNERLEYSFMHKDWHLAEKLVLSDKEKTILLEIEKGTPEKVVAEMIDCTRSGVQYYKTKILNKTHALSIREAVAYLRYLGVL